MNLSLSQYYLQCPHEIEIVSGCPSMISWPTLRRCPSVVLLTRPSSPSQRLGQKHSSSGRGPSAQGVSIEPEDVWTTPRRFSAILSTGNLNNMGRFHQHVCAQLLCGWIPKVQNGQWFDCHFCTFRIYTLVRRAPKNVKRYLWLNSIFYAFWIYECKSCL